MPRGSFLLDVESRGYLTFPPLFPQAELTGAVSELDALLPEMGSDAHRRSLAAPLHLSFRPEPVRRSQVRQLGRRRRVRDPATGARASATSPGGTPSDERCREGVALGPYT